MVEDCSILLGRGGIGRLFDRHQGILTSKAIVDHVGEQTTFIKESYEFSIELRTGEGRYVIQDIDCRCIRVVHDVDSITASYSYDRFMLSVDVVYRINGSLLYKSVEIRSQDVPVTIMRVWVEDCVLDAVLERGGIGQPVFVNSTLFLGIEHPVGIAEIQGNRLRIGHCPGKVLGTGDVFTSHILVYGSGRKGCVEESFTRYIESLSHRTKEHLKIYCDWGLHDELSDEGVELTEKLTLQALETLSRLQSKGVVFDYYLMDAFWFDPAGDYTQFKKSHWPEGFGRAYETMREMNLKFGLWYNVSGGIDMNPDLEMCKARKGHLCLGCKEFQEVLIRSIEYFVGKYDLSMLKFDFAVFDCDNPEHGHGLDEYAREATVDGLLRVIQQARRANPSMIILAYNTFTYDLSWLAPVRPGREGHPISPWWAKYCDMVYCGDPRPSEIPTLSLRDSINCYTDHQIQIFKESLLALEHIDDHGVMVGSTATVYREFKNKWRDIWILMVSRGALKSHFYGDLGLLDSDDVTFMRRMMELVDNNSDAFNSSVRVLGEPGKGEPYGYSCVGGKVAFLTIVNPTFYKQAIKWNELGEEICLVYSSHKDIGVAFAQCEVEVALPPFSVVMLERAPIGPVNLTCEQDEDSALVSPVDWKLNDGNVITATTGATHYANSGIIIRFERDGQAWRGLSTPMQVNARAFAVTGESVDIKQIPNTYVWSGCSWVLLYGCISNQAVNFEVKVSVPEDVSISTWEVKW